MSAPFRGTFDPNATVLENLEAFGAQIAFDADPSTYPFEKRDRAKFYAEKLPVVRRAYRLCRAGNAAWKVVLRESFTTGRESNFVARIIELDEGRLPEFWRAQQKVAR